MQCKVSRNCTNDGKKKCPLRNADFCPGDQCSDVVIDSCSSYSPHIISSGRHLHSIGITGDPQDPTVKHVFVDGKEMKGVQSATIGYSVDRVPVVWLELLSFDVDVRDIGADIAILQSNESQACEHTEEETDANKHE